jgi:hypothetical protein
MLSSRFWLGAFADSTPFFSFFRSAPDARVAASWQFPASTTATIFVPATSADAVTESGKTAGQSVGNKIPPDGKRPRGV